MEQKSGEDPLIVSNTMRKTSESWPACPKKPAYRSSWSLGDFFEKPSDSQEKTHDEQKKIYEIEKKKYINFCEDKIAQIPLIKHLSTRQVIQTIEKRKLEARQAKFAEHNFDRRYSLAENMRPKQPKHAECPRNTLKPERFIETPSDMNDASP